MNDFETQIAADKEAMEGAFRAYKIFLSGAGDDEDERERKRKLACDDLFWLLVYVLGRKDAIHPWVFARCYEVQAAPNGFLDLWPRGHYKSTIITFALTIQEILKDREKTIGIFSFSRPIAKQFLRQIKIEFETNGLLRSLFPDVLWENPHKESNKWSEDEGLIVRRKTNPKESTIEAW